jgi:hypothetical protein
LAWANTARKEEFLAQENTPLSVDSKPGRWQSGRNAESEESSERIVRAASRLSRLVDPEINSATRLTVVGETVSDESELALLDI